MSKQMYAKVLVDLPLLHLDRPFDYSIPTELQDAAAPGARVRVRFAGRKLLGYITEVSDQTERPERVQPLIDVLGPSVVTPEQFDLTRVVADRWVGSQADVLSAAVPPRHAKAEAAVLSLLPEPVPEFAELPRERLDDWKKYGGGDEFLGALAAGSPRAAMLLLPGHNRYELAVDAATSAGRAIILAADARDLDELAQVLKSRFGDTGWVRLSADLGPSARYRNYLRILRGEVAVVIGTRSAAFAPLADLRLAVLLDDGDDSYQEHHTPAWNAREVTALRAVASGTAWLSISANRSCELQYWVERGWCTSLHPSRDEYRAAAPTVRATTDADLARDPVARSARLTASVFSTLRQGLVTGPVLLQVPRRGYQLHLVCEQCRSAGRCKTCDGPLERRAKAAAPSCMWCGEIDNAFSCKWCGHGELRSVAVGAVRTAEEIGRAFPEVPVIRSGRDNVVASVPNKPALVIATPGAEPLVEGGFYAAAAILDADAALARTDLRAEEETARRWFNLLSLVLPTRGNVAVSGDDGSPVVQSLIRADPLGLAVRLLKERTAAGLPPAAVLVEVLSSPGVWDAARLQLPAQMRVLGPVRTGEHERRLISGPRSLAADLAHELRAALARHAAEKKAGDFSVLVDPLTVH